MQLKVRTLKFAASMLASLICVKLLGVSLTTAARAQSAPTAADAVRELPALSAHWAFIYSGFASFPSDYPSDVTIVDGDTHRLLGSIDGGFVSSIVISPDHRELYSADTFYSRGSRGVRTDVVTIYSLKTLQPVGEVVIPPKRQLSAQDNLTSAVTPDGRFLLVVNLAPATSVSVVDLHRRKFVGEIELLGCAEVIMTGNRRFVSLCGDGSILTTEFDDHSKVTNRKRSKPFFDVERDPVFAIPAMIGQQAWFLSYHAMVYPIDLRSDDAHFAVPWPLLSPKETGAHWKPGGLQELSVAPVSRRLYVLMHQGGEWSHKERGKEVWVYNLLTHRRVQRIVLRRSARAIMVTADKNPLLFTVCEPTEPLSLTGGIDVYSAMNGKLVGSLDGLVFFFEHIYGL